MQNGWIFIIVLWLIFSNQGNGCGCENNGTYGYDNDDCNCARQYTRNCGCRAAHDACGC